MYVLFAFSKNLLTGGNITDTENLITHAGNSATPFGGTQGKLKMLNDATIGIYEGLKAQGGNLAAAAGWFRGKPWAIARRTWPNRSIARFRAPSIFQREPP